MSVQYSGNHLSEIDFQNNPVHFQTMNTALQYHP